MRLLTFVLTGLWFCTAGIALAQAPLLHQPDKILCAEHQTCGAAMRLMRIQEGDSFNLAPAHQYDLQKLDIFWDVTPHTGFIEGFISFHFTAIEPLDTFFLDCSDSLIVHNAWYDGIPSGITHQDNILAIALPQTIPAGQRDSLLVHYNGFPMSTGLGSYQVSGHLGDSIVATLSQPYGSRDWWPSKMSLSDKIDTVRIRVKVPEHYKVGSNGLLTHIDYMGSPFVVYNWLSTYPIATYLIAFATYPYDEVIQHVVLDGDTLLVQHYIYPDAHDKLNERLAPLDTMLQIFSELFGPYPFMNEKYGHAQWNRGGGMEHQTMSFMGDFGHDLTAHELAHQWFGDKITCGSWSDIWLNEGFATYSVGLTYERMYGGQWWMPYKEGTRNGALRDSVNSVFVADTSQVGRIFNYRTTYQKGAYVLHQLRYLMGDDAFFAGLYDYATHPDWCYDFTRLQHFSSTMEAHHGASLAEFFNDWYYGNGFPNVHLIWGQQDGLTKFILQQRYHAGNPPEFAFIMSLPVVIYGDGTDTVIDLFTNALTSVYDLNLPFAIDSVKIDPELWWLVGRKTVEQRNAVAGHGELLAYPNPAQSFFTLLPVSPVEKILRVEVFASDGRLIYNYFPERTDIVTINVSHLNSGLYIVRVSTTERTTVLKFAKAP